jgi:ferric-dicitrate binding protein FerR (iron transport regulator)
MSTAPPSNSHTGPVFSPITNIIHSNTLTNTSPQQPVVASQARPISSAIATHRTTPDQTTNVPEQQPNNPAGRRPRRAKLTLDLAHALLSISVQHWDGTDDGNAAIINAFAQQQKVRLSNDVRQKINVLAT